MRRIGLLNSYTFPAALGRKSQRVRGFLEGLGEAQAIEGRDFELDLVESDDRGAIEAAARRMAVDGVDLIHAVGTPNAVAAAAATARIPVVYYGGHPEGIGDDACSAPNVTGQMLSLPFTSSYKKFRFLRRFLPEVRVVWTVFFEGTVFVRPGMRELHAEARSAAGKRVWIAGGEERIGFKSLASLAYIIGVDYRELVYSDAGQLREALARIDPRDGVLMAYNESFYCPGAVDLILSETRRLGLPLIWNNNAHVAALGGLCGIGADFYACGLAAGRTAGAILAGASPSELQRVAVSAQLAWINLDTARELGLELAPDVLAYFDARLEGSIVELGA